MSGSSGDRVELITITISEQTHLLSRWSRSEPPVEMCGYSIRLAPAYDTVSALSFGRRICMSESYRLGSHDNAGLMSATGVPSMASIGPISKRSL